MKKSTLAVAVTLGAIAQQAGAAGFIEDSKATLGLRNFYINTDNREGTANPSRNEEWGQGFDLRFISGYTQGTVGFGLDAIGLLGIAWIRAAVPTARLPAPTAAPSSRASPMAKPLITTRAWA